MTNCRERWLAVTIIAVIVGCKNSEQTITVTPPAPPPASALTMAIAAGNNQAVTAGTVVVTLPAVRLYATADSAAATGVSVTFAVASGGGAIIGATQTTDVNGVATLGGWTLGTHAGPNTVTATAAGVTGSPLTFAVTGAAGPAAAVAKQGGDAQTATVGTTVAFKPAVIVTDAHGNPVANAPVTFQVIQGIGTVIGGTQLTGGDGVATVGGWTLGQAAGPNALTATVGANGIPGNPLTFTATGVAGTATSVVKVAGDAQSGAAGQAVAVAPSVKLADAFGNPIGNQSVAFAALSGGGSVTGAAALTASSGIATLGSWILGAVPGPNTLTATSGNFTTTFTATGLTPLVASQYVGTYSGAWTNTTFASTGTTTVTVTLASPTSVTFTLVGTGSVLGSGGGVTSGPESSTYGATNAGFQGTMPVMGNVTASLDGSGNFVASGVNIPNTAISRWDATGTVTATQIRLNFTVTFTSSTVAIGNIALNHQ